VPNVQHKPIKSPRKGSNKKSKRQPKAALVWRTGLSGVPPDNVWCTRVDHLKLASFGFSGSHSAIIHRTVRCGTGLSGVQAEQRLTAPTVVYKSNNEQCSTARAESEQAPEGAPDSEQWLSGAPPDCPVAQLSEAPMVEPQRLGGIADAPDSVRWRTGLSGAPFDNNLPQRPLWWLGLLKGKCALGPFLSILVIECQLKCLNVNLCHGWIKCKSRAKVCF
jgi:hypothetical protein